jgi:hypothetical protein
MRSFIIGTLHWPFRAIKSRKVRWAGHVARMREMREVRWPGHVARTREIKNAYITCLKT